MFDHHNAERALDVVDLCDGERGSVDGDISFGDDVRKERGSVGRRRRELESESDGLAVSVSFHNRRCSINMGLNHPQHNIPASILK